jgi:hypothetical protein
MILLGGKILERVLQGLGISEQPLQVETFQNHKLLDSVLSEMFSSGMFLFIGVTFVTLRASLITTPALQNFDFSIYWDRREQLRSYPSHNLQELISRLLS